MKTKFPFIMRRSWFFPGTDIYSCSQLSEALSDQVQSIVRDKSKTREEINQNLLNWACQMHRQVRALDRDYNRLAMARSLLSSVVGFGTLGLVIGKFLLALS